MATIAIGDVHGNLCALDDLLAKLVPTLARNDVLVFLGDYIDRGPDTRGCVERILCLREDTACEIVTLLGNHEQWMLRTLSDPASHSWILGMEAFETIASYSADAAAYLRAEVENAGPRLFMEKVRLRYEAFFDRMPAHHLAFFRQLKPFHQTDDVVCVHGGVDLLGAAPNLKDMDLLVWGPAGFPDEYRGPRSVVYGHWNNPVLDHTGWPSPRVLSNGTFGIDTISKGILTAMRFPDGKVFQSSRIAPGTGLSVT